MDKSRRILIVKLSSMGDIIHSLPVASSLRARFPDAFIGWAVEEEFKDLLATAPFIDRIYIFKTRHWRKGLSYRTPGEIYSVIKEIRDSNFDIAIDVQGLIKSGVITYLSGAPLRMGFSSDRAREPLSSFFINRKITPPKDMAHIIDQNLCLVRDLIGDVDSPQPRLFVSEKDEDWAIGELKRMGMKNGDLKVLICPGSRRETKLWNPERYRGLAEELYEGFQARVILIGDEGDKELIEKISDGLPFSVSKFINGSINQMMALFKNVDLVIGGDTGPIHVASALGTPTLSLYGSTVASRLGPRGEGHETIQSDFPCIPCFDRKCRLRRLETPRPRSASPAIGSMAGAKRGGQDSRLKFKEVPCMEAISLDTIMAKFEKILNRTGGTPVLPTGGFECRR